MEHICAFCKKSFKGIKFHTRYCKSNPEGKDYPGPEWRESIRRLAGASQYAEIDWTLVPWEFLSSRQRRERLMIEANFACTRCGFSERRDDGGCILEIDHVDGDGTNNSRENLRVLCPNCHALTPNFRNWGRPGHTKTSTRLRKGNKDFTPKVNKVV